MSPSRAKTVRLAVDLIGPGTDEKLRAQCVNAVHLALLETKASDDDIRYVFHSRTKKAKQAAGKLHAALRRLQDALNHEELHEDLLNMFPPPDIGVDGWP
jgi:hypothetical protein